LSDQLDKLSVSGIPMDTTGPLVRDEHIIVPNKQFNWLRKGRRVGLGEDNPVNHLERERTARSAVARYLACPAAQR
jgi:hypothetical protein